MAQLPAPGEIKAVPVWRAILNNLFDVRVLGVMGQIVFIFVVVLGVRAIGSNFGENVGRLGRSQFICRDGEFDYRCAYDFFDSEAGFDISDTVLDYTNTDPYSYALLSRRSQHPQSSCFGCYFYHYPWGCRRNCPLIRKLVNQQNSSMVCGIIAQYPSSDPALLYLFWCYPSIPRTARSDPTTRITDFHISTWFEFSISTIYLLFGDLVGLPGAGRYPISSALDFPRPPGRADRPGEQSGATRSHFVPAHRRRWLVGVQRRFRYARINGHQRQPHSPDGRPGKVHVATYRVKSFGRSGHVIGRRDRGQLQSRFAFLMIRPLKPI